jgi:GNAT superfamily N-acetyltransferase
MEAVKVTLAQETEVAACLALLPEAVGPPVELLVAKRGHTMVGAAAMRWRNVSSPEGFPLSLHVIPPERRRGIARHLLDAAIDLALDDAVGLWSLNATNDEAATAFMTRCGFEARRREHHFDAAIDAMLAQIAPMTTRLRDRGRVPDDLRIAPLSSSPLEGVAELVARELGSAPGLALDQLRGRVTGAQASADRSRVALRGGQVEGAILWRVKDGVAIVDARVVHPRNRGGWLNAVLLEEGLTRGKAEGLERLRFHCEDSVRDTLSLAKRCDAIEIARPAFYYRPLTE